MTPQKINCRRIFKNSIQICFWNFSQIHSKSSFERYKLYCYKHDDLEKVNPPILGGIVRKLRSAIGLFKLLASYRGS